MVFLPNLPSSGFSRQPAVRWWVGRAWSRCWFSLAVATALSACADADDGLQPAEDPASAPVSANSGESAAAAFESLRNEAFATFDQQGSSPEALTALQAAHALNREAFGVNLRLAKVFSGMQSHGEAMHHYELALVERPDDFGVRREVVALAVSLGRDLRGLELVGPLLEDPSWVGEGTALKARALDNLGRRSEALAVLEGAGELPVAQAASCLTLHGRILHEMGQQAEAYERFAAALALAPDDQGAVKGLADTSRRLGREAEGDRWGEVLQLFLALRDNRFTRSAAPAKDRKAQRVAGRRSDYIGREQEAQVKRLRRMIELHPRWPGAWEQLADLLRRGADHAGACQIFHDLLDHHGALYGELEKADMRARYCDEN
ncbi:MAG: tetratricopeptide (TPR) repeat protein [Pseudohongiellaceae bacterium]|jgi:tetratricopeptide (TPR) repeat protein